MEFGLVTLFGIFLICAIIDTIAPGILGATAYIMLLKSRNKIRRLILFLALTQGAYFLLGIIFMSGNESIVELITSVGESIFMGIVFLGTGILLIIASFVIPRISKGNTNIYMKLFNKIGDELNVKTVIFMAVFIFLMEVTQAFPYWAVLGLMTYNDFSIGLWVPALAVYNILMVIPSILLIMVYKRRPKKAEVTLQNLKGRLIRSNAHLWAICGAGGIFFSIGLNVVLNSLFPH